ncbi:Prolyl tripeptidyl peptidase precursor [Jeotgalicoccus saudimassiliensis]|uniref:Prolyl tripeptidyl peptidase n=1 Tax=Jeotgalicoccus saudimassiliensis TaxID=1461582 RepID=A0A078M9K9_9STAP|nr:S9 family peptidase [Jeotgalicoccus saudimassiliensis]CEA02914.1 Prolyl tripeptidyl peptidase precursor [Jeotgalicoccus saudimassiliensis]
MSRVSVDDIFKIKTVSSPAVVPGTGRVTYLVTRTDEDKDTYYSYLHNYDGRGNLQLTYKNETISNVTHSHDGTMTLFTAPDDDKKTQVFIMRHAGGEREQLTHEENGVFGAQFAHDDQSVFYHVSNDKNPDDKKEKEDKDKKPEATVITRMKYKSDGGPGPYGLLNEKFTAVKSIAIKPDEAETVLSGEENFTLYDVFADGLIYATDKSDNPDFNFAQQLYMRVNGEDKLIRDDAGFMKAEMSPDGRYILMTVMTRQFKNATHPHIEIYDVRSGESIDVTTKLDKPVGGLVAQDTQQNAAGNTAEWISDSEYVFLVSEFGSVNLYKGDVEGNIRPLLRSEHNIFGMTADAEAAYLTISTHVSPSELYKFDFGTEELTQLTEHNHNYVADTELVKPETIEFRSFDDTTVHGWFMKPAGFEAGKNYPMVTNIHGGPHALYANTFFHEMQLLASKGYAVLFINPRGSHSYSQEFVDAVRGDYGNGDYKDIMAAVDHITEKYDWIDTDNLGVTGGSYGGFMTNWIVGHTNRFKAAVTQRSISNWISFRGVSDIGYYFTDWQILAGLDNLDKLWHHSPLKYAANVETPLLILHGEEDIRCPIEQAEQLFIELKSRGKETEFVRFPESSHELSRSGKPSLKMQRLNHITRWFEQYLT